MGNTGKAKEGRKELRRMFEMGRMRKRTRVRKVTGREKECQTKLLRGKL